MDPDANLKEQREIREAILGMSEITDTDDLIRLEDKARRLVDLSEALDEWISKGGFLPQAWRKK